MPIQDALFPDIPPRSYPDRGSTIYKVDHPQKERGERTSHPSRPAETFLQDLEALLRDMLLEDILLEPFFPPVNGKYGPRQAYLVTPRETAKPAFTLIDARSAAQPPIIYARESAKRGFSKPVEGVLGSGTSLERRLLSRQRTRFLPYQILRDKREHDHRKERGTYTQEKIGEGEWGFISYLLTGDQVGSKQDYVLLIMGGIQPVKIYPSFNPRYPSVRARVSRLRILVYDYLHPKRRGVIMQDGLPTAQRDPLSSLLYERVNTYLTEVNKYLTTMKGTHLSHYTLHLPHASFR